MSAFLIGLSAFGFMFGGLLWTAGETEPKHRGVTQLGCFITVISFMLAIATLIGMAVS